MGVTEIVIGAEKIISRISRGNDSSPVFEVEMAIGDDILKGADVEQLDMGWLRCAVLIKVSVVSLQTVVSIGGYDETETSLSVYTIGDGTTKISLTRNCIKKDFVVPLALCETSPSVFL